MGLHAFKRTVYSIIFSKTTQLSMVMALKAGSCNLCMCVCLLLFLAVVFVLFLSRSAVSTCTSHFSVFILKDSKIQNKNGLFPCGFTVSFKILMHS